MFSPFDFFRGFFAFFALGDFCVFFSALCVRFVGVASFFFFLAGYQITFKPNSHTHHHTNPAETLTGSWLIKDQLQNLIAVYP